MDKALYTFHKATQWNDLIIGIVARDIIEAMTYHQGLQPADCINYTLVKDEVEDGIHFKVEIDNPAYEG